MRPATTVWWASSSWTWTAINDTLGHAAGDDLLVEVADRLRRSVRTLDTVARFGGDEFVVLLDGITAEREAVAAADRIHAQLTPPFAVAGQTVFVSASIGIACHSGDSPPAGDLLRHADRAMYSAKAAGKAQSRLYDPAMQRHTRDRLELEADLHLAIDGGELLLYYQPIVQLGTGAVEGFEALVRWQHPARGLLNPHDFIPMAEETGLIIPLGEWVLAEACRQLQAWHANYPTEPPLLMSINLSTKQLQSADLVPAVRRIVAETGVDPNCLQFELTETALLQDETQVLKAMHALKEMGIRLAVDDFGTGYASMAYLKHFPVDVLKIDQSFVHRLDQEAEDAAIVRSVIALGKVLQLTVTGEGIERADQKDRLQQMGCEVGQGFYLAVPLAGEAAAELLVAQRG